MNGSEVGQNKLNAKEFSKDIDLATDLTAAELSASKAKALGLENANGVPDSQGNSLNGYNPTQPMSREQAGGLGNRIITFNPEQNPAEVQRDILDNERVQRMAEIDNGYAEAAKTNSEDLIGVESKTQAKERQEAERYILASEQGQNGQYTKNLMDRNRKRITNETVAAVDKLISDNNYHPGQLDRLLMQSRTNFLKDVFNRILGSWN